MMLRRALVPAIACLGLATVFATPVLAQEEDEDMTFEQKIIHQLMTGLGARGANSKGIEYRERSPLVLPPEMTLPPPQANADAALAPNWPKDPDEQERKAAASAGRKPLDPDELRRPLTPTELAKGRTTRRDAPYDPRLDGTKDPSRTLTPTELGYRGGLFGSFLAPQKEETAVFTGEPQRSSLTDPPAGYQTPSPNYSYGVGTTATTAQPAGSVDPGAPLLPGKY